MRLEYRDRLWGEVDVELHFDPTHRDVRRIIAASRDGRNGRGVCHGETPVVFDASRATHRIVRDALGWPQTCFDDEGCDFWIVPRDRSRSRPTGALLKTIPSETASDWSSGGTPQLSRRAGSSGGGHRRRRMRVALRSGSQQAFNGAVRLSRINSPKSEQP